MECLNQDFLNAVASLLPVTYKPLKFNFSGQKQDKTFAKANQLRSG